MSNLFNLFWIFLILVSLQPVLQRSLLGRLPRRGRSRLPPRDLPGRILVRTHAPARATEGGRPCHEDAVWAFHLGGGSPVVSHLVADHRPESPEKGEVTT
jgi:hypothetical protein